MVTTDTLIAQLREQLQGEVRFDDASRALYATDASNYRQVPIGVVVPRSVEDVVKTFAIARQHGVPILARGAGTSLAGQTCNVALVLDTTKYLTRIHNIDREKRLAWVEPGVVLDDLRTAAEQHGLTFGPDPATHSRCTLGGMIGNNASGAHSVAMGTTVENVEALEILTYDGARFWVGKTSETDLAAIIHSGGQQGEIYQQLKNLRDQYAPLIREKFPKLKRRVSGYNLNELLPENGFNVARALVGTEGTCVFILQARVRLVTSPPHRILLVLGFTDIYQAATHSVKVLPYHPLCVEGMDADLLNDMRRKGKHMPTDLLPAGGAWLFIELGAETVEQAVTQAQPLIADLKNAYLDKQLIIDIEKQQQLWALRESGAAATNAVPGELETYPGWEDAAVEPEQLGHYLRDFRQLLDRYHYRASLYGHFGEGCIHARITFDLHTTTGIKKWRDFLVEAAHLVVHYGGSLSGEHGDGQARAELLPVLFGTEIIRAFEQFKSIWDPTNKMNPGKLVHPYRLDENLRFVSQPPEIVTHFSFAEDAGHLTQALNRCVGVAKCRRGSGGLMCPSYRVTKEEAFSTRGRAHLLSELSRGEILQKNWQDEHIREALEHCLACKGCKADCPVSVDMATYKAEFMAQHYAHKRRPFKAQVIGLLPRWVTFAEKIASFINFFTQTKGLRGVLKKVGGIAPQRQIPRLATQSFTHGFSTRPVHNAGKPVVILWVDTFNNYFHPQVAGAAVKVLEAAGYQVRIPHGRLCCGRPLYDSGQLDLAKQWLQEILSQLQVDILAGVPIIGLEPSCMSVFRDELLNFFPQSATAKKLSQQTFLLSEFLVNIADFKGYHLSRPAIVHGHCHQKALWGMADEITLLKRLGLKIRLPEAGCCGMAGAFGFDPQYYAMSVQLAELALLPSIRAASADTLIIANGFSCREQITQTTNRQVLHLAEVLALAVEQS